MRTRPQDNFDAMAVGDAAAWGADRLLPGPLSAAQKAANDAAIAAPAAKYRISKARIAFGTVAVAVAVTMPDLSAGAMDAPYLLFDSPQPSALIDQPILRPAAAANAPIYTSAMAAERIAPSSLTYGDSARLVEFNRTMPLPILASEADRFDLAFAEVAMPSPAEFAIARPLPEQVPADTRTGSADLAAPLRASLIDVPQISNQRRFDRSADPAIGRSDPELALGTPAISSVGRANESVAAAFAGTLDVSGGVRGALPITEPATGTAAIVGAVPVPAPPSGISEGLAAEAELDTRTRLDARINGVVTGSVEFQQLDGTIAIRLGAVVDLLRGRYGATELDQFAEAGAMGAFVTLADMQAAGIPISYDPVYDEIGFGIDYDDAPQAAKVQMEQIGSPMVGSDRALIDQIPR